MAPSRATDTIVALSSGRPPAAIAIVRVSGPAALSLGVGLAGGLPPPRQAAVRALREADGTLLDRALVLVFRGPASATGEDLVELHCHGGRAVTDAVQAALVAAGARVAEPGEFTRRALINGRIDLAQAEGLADLLEAETAGQRRAALMASEGRVSGALRRWLDAVLALSAMLEALIDFAEEDDVAREDALWRQVVARAETLRVEIAAVLAAPPVERVRDGVRVVIGGPPNSGKSTLLNLLAGRAAAIVSPVSGTTRDRIEAAVQRNGVAYLLVDTAGLTDTADTIEQIGVELAGEAIAAADLLLWLGDEPPPRDDALWVHARADLPDRLTMPAGRHLAVRQDWQESIQTVWSAVETRASRLLPAPDALPFKAAQRRVLEELTISLFLPNDALIAAEQLRVSARGLARLLGIDATEAMLDTLFGRFCLGK